MSLDARGEKLLKLFKDNSPLWRGSLLHAGRVRMPSRILHEVQDRSPINRDVMNLKAMLP